MIPKKIHIIWIGDESKRPDRCIQTWIDRNPRYEVKVWGNADLASYGWVNAAHMRAMAKQELAGVADMMRYEILYHEGGITVDADSVCVRSLENWLLEPTEFAAWENEHVRPGLLGVGTMGSVAESAFFGQIIHDISALPTVTDGMAWQTTGPTRLTQTWRDSGYPLTIYPSHYFIPSHFGGHHYTGSGHVFAAQLWSNTHRMWGKSWEPDELLAQSGTRLEIRNPRPRLVIATSWADTSALSFVLQNLVKLDLDVPVDVVVATPWEPTQEDAVTTQRLLGELGISSFGGHLSIESQDEARETGAAAMIDDLEPHIAMARAAQAICDVLATARSSR